MAPTTSRLTASSSTSNTRARAALRRSEVEDIEPVWEDCSSATRNARNAESVTGLLR